MNNPNLPDAIFVVARGVFSYMDIVFLYTKEKALT